MVASGRTHKEEHQQAVGALRADEGKVLGTVLNMVSTCKVDRIRYGDVEYGYSRSYTSDHVYKGSEETVEAGAISRRDLKALRSRRAKSE